MTATHTATLKSTGRPIILLGKSGLDGPEYIRVLIPYTFREKLNARNRRACHLQIVRKSSVISNCRTTVVHSPHE